MAAGVRLPNASRAIGATTCLLAGLLFGDGVLSAAERQAPPADLPQSIDVGPLRGQALRGTPCTFERRLAYGNPGDGFVRLGLDCPDAREFPLAGFIQVATVLTGEEPAEDSLECVLEPDRDPRAPSLQVCRLRHGKLLLDTRAVCSPDACGPDSQQARDLMAAVIDRVASMPEAPCRLCPQFYPRERVEELTATYTGKGPKRLGTIRVRVDSRIDYWFGRPKARLRVTSGRPRRILVSRKQHQGLVWIARGTYRDVRVTTSGDWILTVAPR